MEILCSLSAALVPPLPGAKRVAGLSLQRIKGTPMTITVDGVEFEGKIIKAEFRGNQIVTTVELPDDFGS